MNLGSLRINYMKKSKAILEKLNKVALSLEYMNCLQEANEIHNIFLKIASDSNLRLAQDVTVTPTTTETMPGGAPDQLDVKVEYNPNATYPQVINSIKELIVSGQKDKAHEAYSWHYNNNTALNAAQKQVLGEQYTAILNRFKGTTPMSNNLAIDLDKTANGIVAQYINKMKINKSQITRDSQSYIALRKMISSIKDLSLRYTAIEILDSIVNMNAKSGLVK